MIFVSLLFALSLLHDYVCIANVIGHGCSIGILSADLFLSVQISIRVFRVHQGQRNCRERNNNSMNGSAVMQSNLSGCAFIVCRECFYRDSASPLFFYRFNSFFFFSFFFFYPFSSDQFDGSTNRILRSRYANKSYYYLFFSLFLASSNNREPRYGIVRRFLCVFFLFFFKRKFRRGLSSRRWQIVEPLSEKKMLFRAKDLNTNPDIYLWNKFHLASSFRKCSKVRRGDASFSIQKFYRKKKKKHNHLLTM